MQKFGFSRYIRYRVQVLLPILLLAVLLWLTARPAAELSEGAINEPGEYGWRVRAAEFVSRVHGIWVAPERIYFLPLDQQRDWFEGFHYVPVVFTALPDKPPVEMPVESNRPDLFYAELAVNRDGVPIDSRRLINVTGTPLASERILGRSGSVIAYSSERLGQVQSIHLYDFLGDRGEVEIQKGISPWVGELMIGLDNLQRTGRWDGVNQLDYLLAVPTDHVESELTEATLRLRFLLGDRVQGAAELNLASGEIQAGEETLSRVPATTHRVGDVVAWAANWVRNQEWVGAERMAVVEQLAFRLSDTLKRWLYNWFGYTSHAPIAESVTPEGVSGPMVIVHRTDDDSDSEWPPAPLETVYRFDEDLENEGQWAVSAPDWVASIPGAPAPYLQTFLRTDRERPFAYVLVVAMDMRQIDLFYQQGTSHPRPTTGRRGTGEIPRDDETMDRVLGAFNGGFKTTHGAFGSMADEVLYLEPLPYRATIGWLEGEEAIHMGTWGENPTIPEDMWALRQNMQPLYADGELNPTNRRRWFADSDMNTITVRSGICMRGEHTMFYFWSELSSYRSLGRAMRAVDCEYGMHLDMNPYHTGWEYYRVNDFSEHDWEFARPTRDMWFHRERYLESDTKDYFYMLRRQTLGDALPSVGENEWFDEDMPTTSEGFLPLAARLTTDASAVQLVALDTSLLQASLAFGTAEPEPTSGLTYRPQAAIELTNPVMMLTFDGADPDSGRGLTIDDWNYFPAQGHGRWLSVANDRLHLHEAHDPSLTTRFEMFDPESLATQSGTCSTLGYMVSQDTLILAWGPVRETLLAFESLGVGTAGVLGCGERMIRLEGLELTEDGRWEATDLLTSEMRLVDTLRGSRSRFFFEPDEREVRVERMYMNPEGDILYESPDPDYERREWHSDEL